MKLWVGFVLILPMIIVSATNVTVYGVYRCHVGDTFDNQVKNWLSLPNAFFLILDFGLIHNNLINSVNSIGASFTINATNLNVYKFDNRDVIGIELT